MKILVALYDDETAHVVAVGRRADSLRRYRASLPHRQPIISLQFWPTFVRQMLSDTSRYNWKDFM